jgi:hypothetical protein
LRAPPATAKGRCRTGTLQIEHVDGAVAGVVAQPEAWCCDTGGTVTAAYKYPTLTTMVLAARVDGCIYVGIAAADAHRPSPGRAWKCLQRWRHEHGPAGAAKEKFRAWIREANVVRVS